MRVVNHTRGTELGDRIRRADNWRLRLLGLMFQPGLPAGGGLWLLPCKQVHTFWMRFPIDLIYLDRTLRVVGMTPEMAPGRVGPLFRAAHSVLELPAGTIAATGTQVGDELRPEG